MLVVRIILNYFYGTILESKPFHMRTVEEISSKKWINLLSNRRPKEMR